jgi:hypothetical protein
VLALDLRHVQIDIPLSGFSGPGLSDHDNYLVFGELSRKLAPSQDFLRGSEAGSDLPSWTSDRRKNTHHLVKLGHLDIDWEFFSDVKDFPVLGGVRLLVERIHIPILRFCQFFFGRVSWILAYQDNLYLFGGDSAWDKAIERLFGDPLGAIVFGRGRSSHGQERFVGIPLVTIVFGRGRSSHGQERLVGIPLITIVFGRGGSGHGQERLVGIPLGTIVFGRGSSHGQERFIGIPLGAIVFGCGGSGHGQERLVGIPLGTIVFGHGGSSHGQEWSRYLHALARSPHHGSLPNQLGSPRPSVSFGSAILRLTAASAEERCL